MHLHIYKHSCYTLPREKIQTHIHYCDVGHSMCPSTPAVVITVQLLNENEKEKPNHTSPGRQKKSVNSSCSLAAKLARYRPVLTPPGRLIESRSSGCTRGAAATSDARRIRHLASRARAAARAARGNAHRRCGWVYININRAPRISG